MVMLLVGGRGQGSGVRHLGFSRGGLVLHLPRALTASGCTHHLCVHLTKRLLHLSTCKPAASPTLRILFEHHVTQSEQPFGTAGGF